MNPSGKKHPSLVWVDSCKDENETEDYFHPVLDEFLRVEGTAGYVGRDMRPVRGNVLRGREENHDTLNIWFSSPDCPGTLMTNQVIHGTLPTLVGDAWAEFIWEGSIIAVMRAGNESDPRHATDITLTAYRDAIDYMGYYRDTIGSMIDGPGQRDHFSKVVLRDLTAKVVGVRINCRRDQLARNEPEMVLVEVPKTHPLFKLEGDDPLETSSLFDLYWVAKAYNQVPATEAGSDFACADLWNPLARLLLLRASIQDGNWVRWQSEWDFDALGSILIVDRHGGDLGIKDVTAMCNLMKEIAIPFMTEENASHPDAMQRLETRLKQAGQERGIMCGSGCGTG